MAAQIGDEADAVKSFRQALKIDPESYVPSAVSGAKKTEQQDAKQAD